LDDFFSTIEISLKDSLTIRNLLILGKEKIIEKFESLNSYKQCTLDYEILDDDTEIYINGNNYNLNDLEARVIDFDKEELQELTITRNKLEYLKQRTIYVYEKNKKAKLIIIPDTLTNIFTIIKERKRAFENPKTSYSYLFKPFKTIEELKDGYDDNFNKAIDVLMAHQKYSNNPSRVDMEHHLYQWLSCFRDNHKLEAILYVIANHQVLSEDDVSQFIYNIEEYKKRNEYLITTLKTSEDNNGTHRLITLQTNNQDLWRELDLKDFPNKLINSNKEKIIFLADVMISGSQTKKAFENYYLAESLDKELVVMLEDDTNLDEIAIREDNVVTEDSLDKEALVDNADLELLIKLLKNEMKEGEPDESSNRIIISQN